MLTKLFEDLFEKGNGNPPKASASEKIVEISAPSQALVFFSISSNAVSKPLALLRPRAIPNNGPPPPHFFRRTERGCKAATASGVEKVAYTGKPSHFGRLSASPGQYALMWSGTPPLTFSGKRRGSGMQHKGPTSSCRHFIEMKSNEAKK